MVVKMSEKCPFCGESVDPERIEGDDNVLYRCPQCGSILEAYDVNHENNFKKLFSRYKTNTFEPNIPEWVKTEEEG